MRDYLGFQIILNLKMGDPPPDPGGQETPIPMSSLSLTFPDQSTPSYAKAVGGAAGGSKHLKKYAEIIAQQKSQRNVLEVKIKKIAYTNTETNELVNPKSLTIEDISEFIFEILNIQFEECVGVDYYTGRYDTREILLKPGVDTTRYTSNEPYLFNHHEIMVKKMLNDVTRVTFRNVPMYVPDEEILHLCGIYGSVMDDKVYWEQINHHQEGGASQPNPLCDDEPEQWCNVQQFLLDGRTHG